MRTNEGFGQAIHDLRALAMFLRAARRVPDPRLGIWLDRQFDRLGRFLPKRRGPASSRA